MRQESNNGIDLLLRQLGRREDAFSSEPSSELEVQHLDADELSSYVANALPAAARARYTAHLADCSSCRKMAVQLSAAEGVVAAQQPVSVVAPSGLKSFLAGLLSPLVLRYAIPALGVIVIAVVGFVMVRQGQREASLARLNEAEQTKAAPPASQDKDSTLSGFVDQTTANKAADKNAEVPKAGVEAPATKVSPRDERGHAVAGPAAGAAPAPASGQQAQPVTTASEPPPPAPKPAAAEEVARQAEPEKKKLDEISKADSSQREYDAATKEQKQADDVAGTGTGSANRAPEQRRAKVASAAGISRDGATATAAAPQSREDSSRTRKREGEGNFATETRAVAGREFYKRGNVWIDVDYNNQGITHIARGSEQYRSLIEDEPAIQTIAETLKSEFIVLWKGRAYRVH